MNDDDGEYDADAQVNVGGSLHIVVDTVGAGVGVFVGDFVGVGVGTFVGTFVGAGVGADVRRRSLRLRSLRLPRSKASTGICNSPTHCQQCAQPPPAEIDRRRTRLHPKTVTKAHGKKTPGTRRHTSATGRIRQSDIGGQENSCTATSLKSKLLRSCYGDLQPRETYRRSGP